MDRHRCSIQGRSSCSHRIIAPSAFGRYRRCGGHPVAGSAARRQRQRGPFLRPAELPVRIVSLLPSATEIVARLGMFESLVGVSHECDFPLTARTLPIVSRPRLDPEKSGADIDDDVRKLLADGLSIYEVDMELLGRLKPDLVITQDHCEVCAVPLSTVEQALCAVAGTDADICTLHPGSLSDVRADFAKVAEALGQNAAGVQLIADFDQRFHQLQKRTEPLAAPRVALVEWLEPPMIAGGWMPSLAGTAGAEPVLVTRPDRFATVDWADIEDEDPDWVVLLACGFDVNRTLAEIRRSELAPALSTLRAVREGRWAIVDGNAYFNRPSPRLADSAELLAALIHPELSDELRRFEGSYARPSWPPT